MKDVEKEFYGWVGKVLDVNLTKATVTGRRLDEVCPDYKEYIGGRGLGVRILYDEVGPDTDPLGPENVLIFVTGPVTGATISSSGRQCVVTKSPLAYPKIPKVPGKSGSIVDSHSGGDWGEELKKAGFDAIIVRGKAEHPVNLWIHNGEAEIRDAGTLWGKTTYETTAAIKQELGEPEAMIACIGPAGENLVRVANVMNDVDHPGYGRAFGRGGAGAVMGSKNLKAITVRGTGKINIAKPEELRTSFEEEAKRFREGGPVCAKELPTLGTTFLNNVINGAGLYPTCNFRWGMFKEAAKAGGEAMLGEVPDVPKTLVKTDNCCRTCVIRCGRITKIPEEIRPEYVTIGEGEGPEYETSWALGAQCGVDDIAATMEANYLCNELGLDTISAGNTIGCAMELCEKGYLSLPKYPAGINAFGDGALMVDLVKKIASREGVGDDLAEGSQRLATKYGHPELSMSVKGLELPAYDPRGALVHGLGYATSNRGGCHVRVYVIAGEVLGNYLGLTPPDIPEPTPGYRLARNSGKIDLAVAFQNLTAGVDALDQCLFTVFSLGTEHYAKDVSTATGVNYTADDIIKVGERIWNLERLFNIREGFTKDDDGLPSRLEETPMPNEIYSAKEKRALTPPVEVPPHGTIEKQPSMGSTVPIAEMLALYYEKRGWTSEGVPTQEKREQLGLPVL